MTHPNRNALWAQVLVDELARVGVRQVCISPGSRSTPLALAFLASTRIESHIHLDERSSAFFALGLAKRARAPVALLCTSGTAAANFFPAIVEASLSRVPLLVLTADRPPEARDWGAAQTIDQVGLYGGSTRWAVDLPVPEPTAPMLAYLRQTVDRAVAVSLADPRGPVHLNVPFRDPLPPLSVPGDVPDELPAHLVDGREGGAPFLSLPRVNTSVDEGVLAELARAIAHEPRGILAVGPHDGDPALAEALRQLSEVAGYPLLAEATSQVRAAQPNLLAHVDLVARSEAFTRSHRPRLALRLGQGHTSRGMIRFVDGAEQTVIVGAPGTFVDPLHRASLLLQGDPAETLARLAQHLRALAPHPDPDWLADFRQADLLAGAALEAHLASEAGLTELGAAAEMLAALPDGVPLYVASSMPIRDLETVVGASPRMNQILANRGANGIDGTLSSALGAAAAGGKRAAVLLGDVAFLHDLGGLLAARACGLSLTALLVNNDGGGIFSFLEVAQAVDAAAFEKLWGTPHGFDFGPAVGAFGGVARAPASRDALRTALAAAFEEGGLQVIEVRTERKANVSAHQRLFDAIGLALAEAPWRCTR